MVGKPKPINKLEVALSATFKEVKVEEDREKGKITVYIDDMFGMDGRFRTRITMDTPFSYKQVKECYKQVLQEYLMNITSMQPRFIKLITSQI